MSKDEIRELVIRRANALGMTAYAIAKASDGKVRERQVRRYLRRECSLGAGLQHVLKVLGLEIRESNAKGA